MPYDTVDTQVTPIGRLEILSRVEVARLLDLGRDSLHRIFHDCALAVLNCGNELDDGKELLERYPAFEIRPFCREHGVELDIRGAPASAFVDGKMIAGIREHLFAVLRDVVYAGDEIRDNRKYDPSTSEGLTDIVFHILRNAGILKPVSEPRLVVCWGGHSISREEYDYTKLVGYQLGLRGLDICTGCGPGAMKGPMKGAAVGHAKQRIGGRYLGFSEPGIIAAESPNPIVNALVIFPDIEKRLEAFVRVGHGIVVFPGGAGTAEEILYLLGILLHPGNAELPFPLILSGPESAEDYFRRIDRFVGQTLGAEARRRYSIVIGDPERVAREMKSGLERVRDFRESRRDAFNFNWLLRVDHEFQQRFVPTHENMRSLDLRREQAGHLLAARLRRAFSGIVAGNVKADGIREIERHGPFEIRGDPSVMGPMDALLASFVEQKRMKLPRKDYAPCYRVVGGSAAA
ncbi:MAG: nucleotide 5'-monophosphate nucleosidase PpnN [Candidatus Accumulibacter sp.]|jgi:predicted Rossmann-fold nucleotide-binding protein|nr:nucleotide 5'-monophosphate nucleosidase PpnN [Accumulibacter sp.]